jgi:hypothetical protein
LKKIFDKTTGITDGTSILKIVENEKRNKANIMTKRLLFGTLMSPTSVATVHQLLLSQFNWLHWERVEQNASIDAVIFDEIHSYECHTFLSRNYLMSHAIRWQC